MSDITFGAHTTLAFSQQSNAPGLGATEGRYAAAIALLGNYMAGKLAAKQAARPARWFRARPNRAAVAVDASAAWLVPAGWRPPLNEDPTQTMPALTQPWSLMRCG